MKTGIFITARNNSEGGGYTISNDLLNSLLYKINKNNKDSFYFILVNDKDNFIKKKLISKNIEFTDFKQNKILSNLKSFFFCICPLLHIFFRFCNLDKFYNLEKKKNISKRCRLVAKKYFSLIEGTKKYNQIYSLVNTNF